MEIFQWKSSEDAVRNKLGDIKDELADVLIYSLMIANELGIDVEAAIFNKLTKNDEKYPVDKFKGSSKKYSEDQNG